MNPLLPVDETLNYEERRKELGLTKKKFMNELACIKRHTTKSNEVLESIEKVHWI